MIRSELRRPRSIARMTWKEKKTERICRGCTRLPVHDGRGPSWALQRTRLPSEHLQGDTHRVVRRVANLFVVMTSLVLGLMMNSARDTFETNNRDIRTLATELILLDRTMRALGPEAEDARRHLVEYVQTSLKGAHVLEEDPQAEASLEAAGTSLRAIRVSDEQKVALCAPTLSTGRTAALDRVRRIRRDDPKAADHDRDPLASHHFRQFRISGSAQHHRDGFVMPGGIAHLGRLLSNPRYGYAIFQHDPSVERSLSTGVGTIAALKAYAASARPLMGGERVELRAP